MKFLKLLSHEINKLETKWMQQVKGYKTKSNYMWHKLIEIILRQANLS